MYLHENATTSNVAGLKTVKRLPLGTRRTWSRSSTSRIKRLFTKSSSSLKSTRSPSIRIPTCFFSPMDRAASTSTNILRWSLNTSCKLTRATAFASSSTRPESTLPSAALMPSSHFGMSNLWLASELLQDLWVSISIDKPLLTERQCLSQHNSLSIFFVQLCCFTKLITVV